VYQTPLKSIKSLRILLSPLNWGLGHVCRTLPIIQTLLDQDNEIIICCDEAQENFYRMYFPELWYVPHSGYPFRFKGKGNWTLDVLSSFSSLNHHLVEEKRRVQKLVEMFNPDLIISDQRFGFVSKKIKSVVISHQLNLPVPKWNIIAKFWNRQLLSAFDEVWIPDTADQKYSGILSDGKHKVKKFIGISSRFCNNGNENNRSKTKRYDFLGIVSGPPPYNAQFLQMLIEKLTHSTAVSAIVAPMSLVKNNSKLKGVTLICSPNHEEFQALMKGSKVVISRSGYSTIMDLVETKNESILIPTPGQAEQLYLAGLHKNHASWTFKTEEEFKKMKI